MRWAWLIGALTGGLVASCEPGPVLEAQVGLASRRSPVPVAAEPARAGPRNVAPMSGVVTSSRVELRWQADGPVRLEIARSRRFEAARREGQKGSSAEVELEAGVWFWRVVDEAGRQSAPWRLRVAPRSSTLVRQSQARGTDTNGDGIDDVLLRQAVVLGGDLTRPPLVLDPGEAETCIREQAGERCLNLAAAVAIGDIDGDGMDDVVTPVAERESEAMGCAPADLRDTRGLAHVIFFGPVGQRDPQAWCGVSRPCPAGKWHRLGDVNLDGYGDVAIGTSVFHGSPNGLGRSPAASFPQYVTVAGGGDMDGDGASDLVGVTADGRLAVHRGSPRGLRPAPAVLIALDTTRQPGPLVPSAELADLTGDGLADALAGIYDDGLHTVELHLVTGGRAMASASVTHSYRWPDRQLANFEWAVDLRVGSSAPPRVVVADHCYTGTYQRDLQILSFRVETGFSRRPVAQTLGGPLFRRFVASAGDVDGDGVDDVVQRGFREDEMAQSAVCVALGTKRPSDTLEAGPVSCWSHGLPWELLPDVAVTSVAERRREDRELRAQLRSESGEPPARCGAP